MRASEKARECEHTATFSFTPRCPQWGRRPGLPRSWQRPKPSPATSFQGSRVGSWSLGWSQDWDPDLPRGVLGRTGVQASWPASKRHTCPLLVLILFPTQHLDRQAGRAGQELGPSWGLGCMYLTHGPSRTSKPASLPCPSSHSPPEAETLSCWLPGTPRERHRNSIGVGASESLGDRTPACGFHMRPLEPPARGCPTAQGWLAGWREVPGSKWLRLCWCRCLDVTPPARPRASDCIYRHRDSSFLSL